MLGSIPGNGKKNIHLIAPKPTVFAKALVDIYQMVQPHLIIMDAIVGMEGNGPNAGSPRKVGLILAGRDSVAMDAVASSIIGFEPMAVPTIRFAHQRGLGVGELDTVNIVGESMENVLVPDFQKPSSGAQDFAGKYLPDFLLAMMFDNSCSTFSTVNHSNCTRCYECVRNCPAGAMSKESGKVVVDKKKCIGCFCCDEVCDFHAIEMKRSLLGRTLLGMAKALGVEKVE
jgi:ferredoxin